MNNGISVYGTGTDIIQWQIFLFDMQDMIVPQSFHDAANWLTKVSNMVFLRVLSAMAFAIIAGCSDPKAVSDEQQPGKKHLFQAQENALQKARSVEQTLQDAADQQRRALERQEQ